MIEVMRVAGQPDPESVVRADRVNAARLGSQLRPSLERMAVAGAEAMKHYERLYRQMRKARRRRITGWSIGLAVSLMLWWGIIAAVRWML